MTFDELVSRCKAGVHLGVNEHRDYYVTIEEHLLEACPGGDVFERMRDLDTCYDLQFYPDTPIGFYRVFGTSLQEVLDKAEECLKS